MTAAIQVYCTCIMDWRHLPWETVMICFNELLALNPPAMSKPYPIFESLMTLKCPSLTGYMGELTY